MILLKASGFLKLNSHWFKGFRKELVLCKMFPKLLVANGWKLKAKNCMPQHLWEPAPCGNEGFQKSQCG
jgi:hypothetical protein